MGLKVLVTGANGFVGRALLNRLTNYECVAFVRDLDRASDLARDNCRLAQGDVTDLASLERAVQGVDVIIHLAAWASDTGARHIVQATNVGGTANAIRAGQVAGVRRFIHMSSCAVYGGAPSLDIDEEHPMRITGQVYHDSKVEAEREVASAAESSALQTVVLRPPHIFGPDSTHFTVRPMKMILEDRVVLIDGGKYHFKPVYIDNLIDAVGLVLAKPPPSGGVYNIADGYVKTWSELFSRYAEILNRRPKMRSVPRAVAMALAYPSQWLLPWFGRKPPFTTGTVRALTSANSYASRRARKELGWEPQVGWDGAMERIASWITLRHPF